MSFEVSLTGDDTLIINDVNLTGLADGDCAVLDFPNELATVKTGKNGNSIFAFNETGKNCTVTLRVNRGGASDKFLNNLLNLQNQSRHLFSLMIGEFVKKIGSGDGEFTSDTYILSGGVFSKMVPGKSNAEGDTEQAVSIYTLKFSNAPRALT